MNHRFLVFVVYQSSWKTLSGGGQQVQGRRVFSLSGAAADNYHEDHIAARHAAAIARVQSLHMLSLMPCLENCPEFGSGSVFFCICILIVELSVVVVTYEGWLLSPGVYFSTSFSRRFVIVTIQSTYLVIIINYIYNIYSISTVYLQQDQCTQHTVNCTVTWPRLCRGLGSSHTCTYHGVKPSIIIIIL